MQTLIENLKNRNFDAYLVSNKEEAKNQLLDLIKEGESVGWGGSLTLQQVGIFDALKGRNRLIDRKEGKTDEEVAKIMHDCLKADVFLTSANAITKSGKLVNIDGRGNRVAATIYGPKKVIFVIGKNKITDNLESAFDMIKNVSSPFNTKRLNKNTPCAKTGKCKDCKSDDRICCFNLVIDWQYPSMKRISVIMVDEELGC